jgi:predicted NUDIX family phosphoesterase
MAAKEEHILVIPEAVVRAIAPFEGFTTDVEAYLDGVLQSDSLSFQPRSQMETDPSYKQLIPYVVLRHTDASGTQRIFAYTRGSGQGEARLHARRSIGIGGHISTEDAAVAEGQTDHGPYRNGMLRELNEEVKLDTDYEERCVGMIYDSTTEVGRVHLGVVHVFDLSSPAVEPNEDDICETGFVTIDELRHDRDSLEIWSQLCLDALFSDDG